jgi:hypothetical protein
MGEIRFHRAVEMTMLEVLKITMDSIRRMVVPEDITTIRTTNAIEGLLMKLKGDSNVGAEKPMVPRAA